MNHIVGNLVSQLIHQLKVSVASTDEVEHILVRFFLLSEISLVSNKTCHFIKHCNFFHFIYSAVYSLQLFVVVTSSIFFVLIYFNCVLDVVWLSVFCA